jgi:hypothetical protein
LFLTASSYNGVRTNPITKPFHFLNPNGKIDTSLTISNLCFPNFIAQQRDEKIIVQNACITPSALFRLFPDGLVDSSYKFTTNQVINNVSLTPENGLAMLLNSRARRLNEDGKLDSTFLPSEEYKALISCPDSTYLIAKNQNDSTIIIKRLTANGQIDTSFHLALAGQKKWETKIRLPL